MKNSFRIAEISFGRSDWDSAFSYEFQGRQFDVQRYGVNFSVESLKALIHQLRNSVDAFAVSSLPPVMRLDKRTYVHRQYLEIMGMPSSVPLCDGTGLREICNINSLIRMIEDGTMKPEKGVFFPSALMATEIEEFLRKRGDKRLYFGDAYALFRLPVLLQPFPGLMTISKGAMNLANLRDLRSAIPSIGGTIQKMSRSSLIAQIENTQYVVTHLPYLTLFDVSLDFIRGKDLLIWSHHPGQEALIKKFEPASIRSLIPEAFQVSPYINYPLLDASLRLIQRKTSALSLDEWEKLLRPLTSVSPVTRKYVLSPRESTQVKLTRRFYKVKGKISKRDAPNFAFIIHPLAHSELSRAPGVGGLVKMIPPEYSDRFDRAVAHAPAFVYGHVSNVISEATGREVNGLIYTLTATPKVLKATPPEVTYAKIERICQDAANRGAKILGLGAYTKVIGDSGITINQNSPIPVTTGNSLSASATLWGLYDVIKKMRLLSLDKDSGRIDGMAMVIGATGSIGSVSSKLLSLAFKKICLVAPRMQRLEELAAEIRQIAPNVEIVLTTDANQFAGHADVLVTATSALDSKIVDVMVLKPGCVVCDCSRPLDFTIEDAKKRPDVLIVESGEVVLPGPYSLDCYLGLPGKTVYACLAETALLALEERYEPFTLGRDLDWVKVKEIYKLSKRHGVRLSAIQGHMGIITDRELELTRELALSRRAQEIGNRPR